MISHVIVIHRRILSLGITTRTTNEGRKFVNDNQTVIGKNYSAWPTESTTTLGEITVKSIDDYAINGNIDYKFSYVAPPGPAFNQ